MKSFKEIYDQHPFEEVSASIRTKSAFDVELALSKEKRSLEDFKALISPAAQPYLEQMAVLSRRTTLKRFGKTLQMYVPMYLSNECQNICTYCGFSLHNKVKRVTLSDTQILQEALNIKKMGFDHILLVTGESSHVGIEYFLNAIKLLRPYFSQISIEVQPLLTREYQLLKEAGVNAVLVYQETYHKEKYKQYHTKGKKSNFYNRLQTPELIGTAGMHKIGLGVLLGLEDWRTDSFFTALHLSYMEKHFWRTRYSISFPRIRPAEGMNGVSSPVNDKELTQLICAYRLLNEELELSLSTRESQIFRDNIVQLGITSLSAGSKTNPGGYSKDDSLEQFEIDDKRSPKEIETVLKDIGYEVVWKDWDKAYSFS